MRFTILILVAAFIAAPTSTHGANLTERIKRETNLDEQIKDLCNDHCQGNRRRGRLRSLHAVRRDANHFLVTARADLRNRHHVDDPLGIGGGFQAYSYTIHVEAEGSLDTRDCSLTITEIDVENDRLGLSHLASREEGKTHKIENCRRLVRGL